MPNSDSTKTNTLINPLLSVRKIDFSYPVGSFRLIIERLDIFSRERIAVIGPNGAGKTTLLRLMALLHPPELETGEVIFRGEKLSTKDQRLAYHRSIGFVPQKTVLYQGTVKENVAIGVKIRGWPRSQIEEQTSQMLTALKLSHLATRSIQKISGGEARRVMIARILVLNPKILFLDEPFGDLDESVRHELIDDLLPILIQNGTTTIFVTHNQEESYRLAERFIIISQGRIVQDGSAQEVFGNPLTHEVAKFIGIKNILSANVIAQEKEHLLLCLTSSNIKLWAIPPPTVLEQKEVHVSILPESIIIIPTGQMIQTSSRNILPGIIKRIIPTRYFVWVEVDCGVLLTASITHEAVKELNLKAGKAVHLLIKSTAIKILKK